MENDLVYRLRKRAEIRRQIPNRKSVQENQPDRIADLLEESANEIEKLKLRNEKLTNILDWMSNGFGIDHFENLYDIELNEQETNNG
jgi:hypothetical protein